MKLSDVTTKLTCMQSNAVRALAAIAVAGAFLAAAPAAQAQHVSFGVVFGGGPRYVVAPPPRAYIAPGYGYGYYDPYAVARLRQHEVWERQQAFERQQIWEREHRYENGRFEDRHFDGDRR